MASAGTQWVMDCTGALALSLTLHQFGDLALPEPRTGPEG